MKSLEIEKNECWLWVLNSNVSIAYGFRCVQMFAAYRISLSFYFILLPIKINISAYFSSNAIEHMCNKTANLLCTTAMNTHILIHSHRISVREMKNNNNRTEHLPNNSMRSLTRIPNFNMQSESRARKIIFTK